MKTVARWVRSRTVHIHDVFGALKAKTGTADTNWRFTGELQDPSVGRAPYYLRARYYDPALGRFLSRAPLRGIAARPQSQNHYPYVLNNPALFVDPYGCFPSLSGFGVPRRKQPSLRAL